MGALKTAVGAARGESAPRRSHAEKAVRAQGALKLPRQRLLTAPQWQTRSYVVRPAWFKETFSKNTSDGNFSTLKTSSFSGLISHP